MLSFQNCLHTTHLHSVATKLEVLSSQLKNPQSLKLQKKRHKAKFKNLKGSAGCLPGPGFTSCGYLNIGGDVTGQRHVQDHQWLLGGGAVRKEVASSVRSDPLFYIHPIFYRVHSLRPDKIAMR